CRRSSFSARCESQGQGCRIRENVCHPGLDPGSTVAHQHGCRIKSGMTTKRGEDMPITKGYRQLVDEATAQITTYSVAQTRERMNDPKMQIVDIRDVRELEREGTVPGCIN